MVSFLIFIPKVKVLLRCAGDSDWLYLVKPHSQHVKLRLRQSPLTRNGKPLCRTWLSFNVSLLLSLKRVHRPLNTATGIVLFLLCNRFSWELFAQILEAPELPTFTKSVPQVQEFQVILYLIQLGNLRHFESSDKRSVRGSRFFIRSKVTMFSYYCHLLIIECIVNRNSTFTPWNERSIMQAHYLHRHLRVLAPAWYALNLFRRGDQCTFCFFFSLIAIQVLNVGNHCPLFETECAEANKRPHEATPTETRNG